MTSTTRRGSAPRSGAKRKAPTAAKPERVAKGAAAKPERAAASPAAKPKRRLSRPERVVAGRGAAAAPAANDGLGKYVYCVIASPQRRSFGRIGIGPEPTEVYTVHDRDLAAVVSGTPVVVHDPTRENVLAHQSVTETVMRKHTVIPMSFGTVFKTDEDIRELLRSASSAFRDVLSKMENKFEFGLKVLWDRDEAVRGIEGDDEGVRRLKGEIEAHKGSTYFARVQYGRLVDAALQTRAEHYVADIFAALRGVSVASRANRPIGDRMILNAAFLVSRDREAAFDAKVKEIGSRFDNLTFKYTGPWPPYNFVNIRLKLERAK